MSKKWFLTLSGSLLAAMIVTGCAADDQDPAPPEDTMEETPGEELEQEMEEGANEGEDMLEEGTNEGENMLEEGGENIQEGMDETGDKLEEGAKNVEEGTGTDLTEENGDVDKENNQ